MTIEERLKQAREQVAYWEQQRANAEQQLWMWRGAVGALEEIEKDEPLVMGAEEEMAG